MKMINNDDFFLKNKSKYFYQRKVLENWKKNFYFKNRNYLIDENSEGYINPKVYEDSRNNKSFYYDDKDRYYDQCFELNKWRKAWEEKTPKNETSFFGKIKNFFKK